MRDFLVISGGVLVLLLFFGVVGSCKKWQYDECVNVGHSKTYCMADTAGCFDGGRKK